MVALYKNILLLKISQIRVNKLHDSINIITSTLTWLLNVTILCTNVFDNCGYNEQVMKARSSHDMTFIYTYTVTQ